MSVRAGAGQTVTTTGVWSEFIDLTAFWSSVQSQAVMASLMFSNASFSSLPWETQPGRAMTELVSIPCRPSRLSRWSSLLKLKLENEERIYKGKSKAGLKPGQGPPSEEGGYRGWREAWITGHGEGVAD
jgi:hypothetical protein